MSEIFRRTPVDPAKSEPDGVLAWLTTRRISVFRKYCFLLEGGQENRSCVCGYSFRETVVLIKYKNSHVDGITDLDFIIMFCLFIN